VPKTVTPTPIIAKPPTLPTIRVVAAVQHINQDNRWHVWLTAYNAVALSEFIICPLQMAGEGSLASDDGAVELRSTTRLEKCRDWE